MDMLSTDMFGGPPSSERDPVVGAVVCGARRHRVSLRVYPPRGPAWQACTVPKHLQHDVQHELERAHTHAPTRGLTRIGPTRRSVLVGASAAMGLFGVWALTSCGNDQPAPEAIDVQPTPAPEPDPNLIDELNLIGAYLGAIEAFPELRGS
jgi:hypothetical protein